MSPDLEPEFEINYSELRNKFKTWLSKYSQKYSKDILSYLDKYISNKIIKNREELLDLINSVKFGKRHLCYSLRVFFNFLEDFEILDEEILDKLRKIVKIPRTGVDGYVPNDEEILKIYKMIDDERYRILYKLLAFSGIRLIEGEELLRNFDKKRLQINDKVAKYPIMFDRRTKKLFYAYFPSEFANELRRINVPHNGLSSYLKKRNFKAKYLRKWNYNFLILNGVPESVADFIQGRASITVGSMHYLAKVKQADEWYNRVVDKLFNIFNF